MGPNRWPTRSRRLPRPGQSPRNAQPPLRLRDPLLNDLVTDPLSLLEYEAFILTTDSCVGKAQQRKFFGKRSAGDERRTHHDTEGHFAPAPVAAGSGSTVTSENTAVSVNLEAWVAGADLSRP
jgi:hypothetical protein